MSNYGTVPQQYIAKTIAEKREWRHFVDKRKSYVNQITYDDYDDMELGEMRVRRNMSYVY